ncbi:MAG: two-component system response regulator [Desulfobulbaceae bacterium]|nr:two-component system response regulator [Desulfobulbaceae bacterium]
MSDKSTILVVDDTPENLTLISSILKAHYKVKVATSGAKALSILTNAKQKPDIILLDILMPEMDGYEVCHEIKRSEYSNIPVIFLTALTKVEEEEKGLQYGAVDYIHKPISPPVLLARVATHLQLKEARDFLTIQNSILAKMVKQRTMELAQSVQATIVAMGALAEFRDPETGNHLRRTQHYIKNLAEELAKNPDYGEYLSEERIDVLFKSAPLHDIGKVGVPDSVLFKPGKLDTVEFETMKEHTLLGKHAIQETQKQMNTMNSFLTMSEQIAAFHHEKWNGTGYPYGLIGANIPLSARLMAVADVYDALVSERAYKPAFPHEEAVRIIRNSAGSHFDPDVVAAFLRISDQFAEILDIFSDKTEISTENLKVRQLIEDQNNH